MKEYSNKEIDLKFDLIQQSMKSSHDTIQEKLDLILAQTTKTNGRVSSLEKWRLWLTASIGALSAPTVWVTYMIVNHLMK